MYCELHCKTNFSFLEGASHPEELVARAAELGYAALAITDRHSLAGVVRAHGAAKDLRLKLIIGAEIAPLDAPPVVLWASDRAAYGRLTRLITAGCRRAAKGECALTFDDLAAHQQGLLAGILPLTPRDDWQPAEAELATQRANWHRYRELLGDRCSFLVELQRGPDDQRRLEWLAELSREMQIPLAAAGDVHYHLPERMPLQHVLTAVRHGVTVDAARPWLFPNAERHLKSVVEINRALSRHPAAIERGCDIARRCIFTLDELRYEYPDADQIDPEAPVGESAADCLMRLTWRGALRRYPDGVPDKVRKLVEHELALIADLHYEPYFLTVWDLVRFARSRDILCQGRGSAANSAVCFCLEITSVDPGQMDVLFERFISRERNEAPDIDVDFEHERREEVLQYVYEKYGRERAGITAEVICYRPRSAVRDVGKALGLAPECVDAVAKSLDNYRREPRLDLRLNEAGLDPESQAVRQLRTLVEQLLGFPRHLSQHVGGMVITRGELCELTPIENAAMPGRTVIEWNKDDLDELGILKVDCLALGMLTAIRKCFALVRQHTGQELTLASIPPDDSAVYDMICRADTMGVFQIESRAQMSMLPRLRPRTFYDLVIEVAIVRPGPIQGDMVHPYLRRRAGEEEVVYPSEAIREVLHKTLGVPLFQEQAMRLAVVAAGFSPGEADQLRRAMGAWRRPGVIDEFRKRLLDGMLARGLSQHFAEQVFNQIRGFGEYGFPESHATSFALLVYVSAWLKHYYPAAFAAALINSQPMGFYAPAQLVRNAQEHGVEVRPIDVNESDWDCTLETHDVAASAESPWALRLGMRMLVGFSQTHARAIERARAAGRFQSLDDLVARAALGRGAVERLAAADACRSLAVNRRQVLWQALDQERSHTALPLLDDLDPEPEPLPLLPQLTEQDEVYADYRTAGLTLRAHPVSFYRAELDERGIVSAERLATWPEGQPVSVAGLVLVRQRPGTAKGITFVTLEDETGTANLVVHQHTWQRHHRVAISAAALIVHGRLERKGQVIHVIVRRLEDLSQWLRGLRSKSRDFQ